MTGTVSMQNLVQVEPQAPINMAAQAEVIQNDKNRIASMMQLKPIPS